MVITFNYKDGTDTITFDDLKTLGFQGFFHIHFAVLPLFLPFTASEMLIAGRR